MLIISNNGKKYKVECEIKTYSDFVRLALDLPNYQTYYIDEFINAKSN